MITDCVIEDERWDAVALEDLAERAAVAVLEHLDLGTEGYEIAVLACDDARIQELNADFRDKDKATNVLSWPSEERAPDEPGEEPYYPETPDPDGPPEELGDIAISYDTCLREANDAEIPFENHVTHLMIHAVLHLLGHDHIDDRDATLMEGIETEILGKMGIPDPYTI
ncbi:rRNA maturation RNase YbeY [Donghicola sp. C2-DW-16]|uniref:Endoribonuclease YbeY n=1 Tax=Donghicola mangrovi TaxID=2729614 RepID=A0ABX2PIA2_9RHOB|nr:rRNA maturation RNase YbeY [Donghicola mangrovi]NVO29235.1 rRNA maturation RNase YbeY [Donghicola mangrovi]